MPTRKQRRRREKDRRHEWEYVYVDEEGQEVEVDEDEPAPAKPAPAKAARQSAKTPAKSGSRPKQSGRPLRTVDPPSWQRVFKRAAIFAPVMVIVVYLLRPKDSSAGGILFTLVVLLLFFLPFSYMMDGLMYRAYRKRIGDPIPPRERKPKARS